jgi:hypothetical protein
LLLPDSSLQNFHHSGQDDLAEYFAGNTEKVDAIIESDLMYLML